MTTHVTYLHCDAPGCVVQFSSVGLPASNERYVLDAAVRRGWLVEEQANGFRLLCPAHSEKEREAKVSAAEKAVRLLINNPDSLRSSPPFLVGKLKLSLTDFNAKTMSWRKA